MRRALLLAAFASSSASVLTAPRAILPSVSTQPVLTKALELRGGGVVPAEGNIKASAIIYGIYALDVPLTVVVAYNFLVGLIYPWNAAYISKLPVKYPMHYVPELLMAGLTVAGLLAL